MKTSGLAVAAVMALAVAGCTTGDTPAAESSPGTSASPPSSATSTGTDSLLSEDYSEGLPATMHLPENDGPADLVVLVPGGGWSSADPTGLIQLAERLADDGATAVTITYSTTDVGAKYPTPVDDVACAVRWAAKTAADHGRPPNRVILFGHSAGGHLAALVATSGDRFGSDCADPAVPIDGLIGVAGVYDVSWAGSYLNGFFGGNQDEIPDTWDEGDPMWWVESGEADLDGLRVLLVHGDADSTVPVSVTTTYAKALTAAGQRPDVEILPGETHLTVFEADVIGPTIETWLAG